MTKCHIPLLADLMNGYFNQDYDVFGDTDVEILHEYKRSSYPATITATIAEIDSLLAVPEADLKKRFEEATGKWNVVVGEDDQQVRKWLIDARDILLD